MAAPLSSNLEARREQIFPTLDAAEIQRLGRFGPMRTYGAGTALVTAGLPSPGLQVILSGTARVQPHDEHLRDREIVEHRAGSLVGELTGLSGTAALVDVIAITDVEALLISTARLRDLMIEEVGLGERIMRALILRRVALLESTIAGPIIVGRDTNRDVTIVRRPLQHLFLFIGAEPNAAWHGQCDVEVDTTGFVRADPFAANGRLPFQTNRAGVFAIGDIRSGSIKRVAAAVGEGAQVVPTLHQYLGETAHG